MKYTIATTMKCFGGLGTGILMLGASAPLASSTFGFIFVTIGYAMLLLAFGGHILDVNYRYPSCRWPAPVAKAINALFANLSTATFVSGLGQAVGAFGITATAVSVMATLLLALVMTIICVGAYFTYRHFLDC